MKRLALSLVVMCFMALTAMAQKVPPKPDSINLNSSRSNVYKIIPGPGGTLNCTADGKPCTQDQVNVLMAAINTSKSNIKRIALAKNGSLMCDEKPCTTAHLPELNKAASALNAKNSGHATEK